MIDYSIDYATWQPPIGSRIRTIDSPIIKATVTSAPRKAPRRQWYYFDVRTDAGEQYRTISNAWVPLPDES